jgi:hypothetical protein
MSSRAPCYCKDAEYCLNIFRRLSAQDLGTTGLRQFPNGTERLLFQSLRA